MRPRLDPRQVRILGLGASVEIEPRRPRQRKQSVVGQFFPRTTRVLGLDLAATTTGWALFDAGKFHSAGTIKLPAVARTRETRPSLLWRRFCALLVDMQEMINEYQPAVIAYEFTDQARPVWSGGSKGREFVVASALGRMEQLLVDVLGAMNFEGQLVAVPLSAAKRRIVGRVNANKGMVRDAVARTIGQSIVEQMTDDQSDAACIALSVLEAS